MPRAATTSVWNRPQGSRSSRAGMSVSTIAPLVPIPTRGAFAEGMYHPRRSCAAKVNLWLGQRVPGVGVFQCTFGALYTPHQPRMAPWISSTPSQWPPSISVSERLAPWKA